MSQPTDRRHGPVPRTPAAVPDTGRGGRTQPLLGDAGAKRPERKRVHDAAPTPQRHRSYVHLSLDDVRELREQLFDLQTQIKYWQQVIRQRLATVRSARPAAPRVVDHARTLAQSSDLRQRLHACDVWPTDDLVALPDLVEVWSRTVEPGDALSIDRLGADLEHADARLAAVHQNMIDRRKLATFELLARYRENPTLALTLLPDGFAAEPTVIGGRSLPRPPA